MSEHDAIVTISTLPGRQNYIIEYGGVAECFGGDNATEWFWSCMDAIKQVIEDWNIKECPKMIRIAVRCEQDDKSAMPYRTVHIFRLAPAMPWIDLDEFEQRRDFLFMFGQALAMAWRNRDAAAIVKEFNPYATNVTPEPVKITNPDLEILL